MAIEIVDLPINSMVVFQSYVSLPEGVFRSVFAWTKNQKWTTVHTWKHLALVCNPHNPMYIWQRVCRSYLVGAHDYGNDKGVELAPQLRSSGHLWLPFWGMGQNMSTLDIGCSTAVPRKMGDGIGNMKPLVTSYSNHLRARWPEEIGIPSRNLTVCYWTLPDSWPNLFKTVVLHRKLFVYQRLVPIIYPKKSPIPIQLLFPLPMNIPMKSRIKCHENSQCR